MRGIVILIFITECNDNRPNIRQIDEYEKGKNVMQDDK